MHAVPSFTLTQPVVTRYQSVLHATCARARCEVRRWRRAPVVISSAAGYPAPTPEGSLAQQIASAFVVACTRTDVPYAQAIRKFVTLALEAYARGIPLPALRDTMLREARLVGSDEIELRDVWVSLVYKTLRAVHFPINIGINNNADLPPPPDHFDAFVRSIVAARKDGSDLKRIQLELNVSSTRSSPLESAILSQSTRLVVATLDVADERRRKQV